MRKASNSTASRGTLKRVAQGLYRYSTSGVYFAHVRIHGKLFRESLHVSDRQLADRKLREFRAKRLKIDPRLAKLTLKELCDRYEQTLGHLSASSIKAKKGILERVKSEWPERKLAPLRTIKPSDCEKWLAKQAKRVGRSHYNAYLQLLRDIFHFAVRDGALADSPAAHLKYLKRERPLRLTPSWDEFRAIVQDIRAQVFNADAKDSADFVEFIGLSGLGRAEAASLTCNDINFEREQITTFRHKTRTGFAIPLFPQLRPLLEKLLAERTGTPNEPVFAIRDAKKAIAGACRRLKLPAYNHRAFRRMFITRAIEKGIDVKVIAEWQGHRDGGKLILDTYSHVNRAHSRRMAQLMTDEKPDNVVQLPVAQAERSIVS
jgi:integrase